MAGGVYPHPQYNNDQKDPNGPQPQYYGNAPPIPNQTQYGNLPPSQVQARYGNIPPSQVQAQYGNSPKPPQGPGQNAHQAAPQPQYLNQPQAYGPGPNINVMPQPIDPSQQYSLAECARGNHERGEAHFGITGIIAAILCFPCGIVFLFLDRDYNCAHCHRKL